MSIKKILSNLKIISFDKKDNNFLGTYFKVLDKFGVMSLRPDPILKTEGIIKDYTEMMSLGFTCWMDVKSQTSFLWIKHKIKNQIKFSLYIRTIEDDGFDIILDKNDQKNIKEYSGKWILQGHHDNYFEAINWLNVAISATEPRIFEAMKVTRLDRVYLE